MSERRQIPPESREEAQVGESLLYGVLWGLLSANAALIQERMNYLGTEVTPSGEPDASAVKFSGLTIHMASGAYRVTITRDPSLDKPA